MPFDHRLTNEMRGTEIQIYIQSAAFVVAVTGGAAKDWESYRLS